MYSHIKNKDKKSTLSELERQKWDDHRETCPAQYSEYTNYHLETAVAPELIKHAHKRVIVFHTLISDGDSDAVESLNTSETYMKLGINQNIKRIECHSHVMRAMMNDLIKSQLEEGEGLMKEASVESQPKEIKNMTRSLSGKFSHLYRLALRNNEGNPTGAKAEINAIPSHLGANDSNSSENHRSCQCVENSRCDYQSSFKQISSPSKL